MSINPLNDITRVYLEQVVESSHLETNMEKRHEKNEKAVEDMKKTKGYKDMAAAARKKMEEGLDPVGQEDSDIDNDGDTDKSDKYLHKRRKAIGKAITKKKGMKEGYSDWRQDLSEVMTDVEDKKKIKEKKIENKITINPKVNEAVEEIGGTLLEMVEIDEFDFIVESAYNELLEEGYEEDDIEDALGYALTEAKVTFGHDTPTSEKKKESLLDVARKKLSGIKKTAKQAVATGARKIAKGALGVARKMEGGDTKPSPTQTKTRTASTYRGAGVGTKERVSSGSYTPPKATTKKTAAPKAKAPATTAKKKKKSNLDDLLSSIRNESVIDEKINLKKAKMGDVIKDFYKSDAPQFKGRSKEKRREMAVAAKLTAERGGRRLGEQMTDTPTSATPDPAIDRKQEMLDKAKMANLKMLQQKKQQLDRQKLQMQKTGKLPLEASYEPEGEVIDERRKEDKVAGTPRKPRNPAFELVAKSMGTNRLGVKPRGVKKEKGAPTPGPSVTPSQKVEKRRASTQRAQSMYKPRAGESD